MNQLKTILSKNIRYVIVTIVLNIVASFAMVYAGYSLSYIFNGYESGGDRTKELIVSCAFVIGIWLVAILLLYISGLMQAATMKRIKNNLRLMMSEKLSSIDYGAFVGKDSGNYISWLTNDVDAISAQSFLALFSIVTSISTVLFSIVALFIVSVYVGATSIVLFFLVSLLPQLATMGLEKANKARSQAQEESLERFKDSIMGFPIFYLTRSFNTLKTRIQVASKYLEEANYAYSKRTLAVKAFIIFMSTLGQIVILAITVFAAILGFAPIGAVLSVGNLSGSFFNSISEVAQGIATIKASKSLWEKFQITNQENATVNMLDHTGSIICKNLRFAYDETEILNIEAMEFQRNGKYALVGESGSGKTTLVKLLLGLLKNKAGTIEIGKIPLSTISKDSLYRKMAYVEQQVYLFQDTLRFNITLGADYSEERIQQTIDRCRLRDFVNSLQNGIDTLIAEDGKNMSGGQRQRIALARALIRNVDFIILDEGTSALDKDNALDIELSLVNDPQIGVIIITHNLRDEVRQRLDLVYELKNRTLDACPEMSK